MIPRVRTAGFALLALLAGGSPCWAAVGMASGRGAIGGQFGGSLFWGQDDYSEGAKPRLAFAAHFRYVVNQHLRWQISPGFTWSGYAGNLIMPVSDDRFPPEENSKHYNLALLLPMTVQAQLLFHTKKWHYHVGGGPGVYRVWVENHRVVLPDPVTFVLHRGLYAGVTGEFGVERFVRQLPSTSVEASLTTHWVAARRNDKFPSGYNSAIGVTEVRIGANYYFDMGRLRREKATALPPTSGK